MQPAGLGMVYPREDSDYENDRKRSTKKTHEGLAGVANLWLATSERNDGDIKPPKMKGHHFG